MAVVYVVVNQIEGNVALPLITGRSVRMHPAVIAVGVLVTGSLFGALGLVLAIPLISLALILVEELWIKRLPPRAPRASGHERDLQRSVLGAIAMGALLIVVALLAEELATLLLAAILTIIISLPLEKCLAPMPGRGLIDSLIYLEVLQRLVGAAALLTHGSNQLRHPHLRTTADIQPGRLTAKLRHGHRAHPAARSLRGPPLPRRGLGPSRPRADRVSSERLAIARLTPSGFGYVGTDMSDERDKRHDEQQRDAPPEDRPGEPGAEGGSDSPAASRLPGAPSDDDAPLGDTDQHSAA